MNGPTPRAGSPPPHPRHRSVLPHCLAVIYGLAIAYASLQPFSPWIAPPPGTPFFLFAPGRYLLRAHYSPYWRLEGAGCAAPGPDKMTILDLTRPQRFALGVPGTPGGLVRELFGGTRAACTSSS